MANEVSIRITAVDDTEAAKAKLRAGLATAGVEAGKEFGTRAKEGIERQAPAKLPVEAKDPIDEAWRAQIQASIKSISADAVKIPMSPDTAKYREELHLAVGELSSAVKQKIPVDLDGADQFKLHVEELAKTVSEEVKAKIKVEPVSEEIKAKIKVEPDEQSAEDAGRKTATGVSQGITARGALIGTAIAAGVLAGGPVIAAAGVGMGVVMMGALGAAIQKGDPALAAGWAKFSQDATGAGKSASAGIVAPLTTAMGQIDALITRESPVIKKLFTDAAGDIPILTQGLDSFVSNSLPGFESGMANSQPVVRGLAGLMGDLGHVAGDVGSSFGSASSQAETGLNALGTVVVQVGQSAAELITFTTKLASGALPTLSSGLNSVLGAASGVLHALEPIAPVLGSITVYGLEAWSSFKLAGLATAGIGAVSTSLSSLSTNLTAAGAKMLDTNAGATALGAATAEGAGKLATFAGKASSLASAIAGPLGLALGVGVLALELFGASSQKAAEKQQQQRQVSDSLMQVLVNANGVVDASTQKQSLLAVAATDAGKALLGTGFSQAQLNQSLQGGPQAIQSTIDKLQGQVTALKGSTSSLGSFTTGQFAASQAAQVSSDILNKQIDALGNIKIGMEASADAAKALIESQNQQATALGITVLKLNGAQMAMEAYDSAINNQVANYMQSTSAIKVYTDAQVSAAGANLTATANFQQLDEAVASAEQSVVSAANGVASAQHSIVDAGHAVEAARHGEQQAVLGVTDAQYGYRQSLLAEQTAQQNLMTARQAAADQLASLQRQVTDQIDTEDAAKLHLLEAQEAVNAAGLGGTSLASLGDPTAANQKQYGLLLTLSQAQHALNDTQAQGAALNKQNADAQKAGINGSLGVIQAQQQLEQAQHGVQQATRAVTDAQYAERQAVLSVQDALWSQHSAQLALTQSQQAGAKAQRDLTAARDADSRTLDINTLAGNRNWQTVEDLYYKNLAATGSTADATAVTERETGAMGFNKDAVQRVINTLGGLNGHQFNFSVVGTPSLDLGPVKGILRDNDLGLFTNARGDSGGIASAGRLAAGGSVAGPGGPRDDVIHAMLSAGEYVQPADVVDHYGVGFMEALRSKRLPKFATGGSVGSLDLRGIMGLNAEVASLTGMYEGAGVTANALGAHVPTALSRPGNFKAGAFSGMGSLGPAPGVPQSRQANEAIVNAIFSNWGWGSGAEWDATVHLLMQESGFNNTAQNPTSTAYGMFQFLDDTWGGYGVPKTSDPYAQTLAGARYLKARYGDPLGAWRHEQAYNWYAAGGPVGGGVAGIHDRGAELVRLPNGSTVIPHSGIDKGMREAMAGHDASQVTLTINAGGTALDQLLLEVLRKAIRQQGGNVQLVLGNGAV